VNDRSTDTHFLRSGGRLQRPIPGLAIFFFLAVSAILSPCIPAKGDDAYAPSVANVASAFHRANQDNVVLHVIIQTDPVESNGSARAQASLPQIHGVVRGFAPRGGYIAADVSPTEAIALAHRPGVHHVSFDWPVGATDGPGGNNNPKNFASPSDGAQRAMAPTTWQSGVEGAGVGVAIIDSGIQNHPDLQGPNHVVAWHDFVNGKGGFYDDYGHGTHVAGIIAGTGSMSSTYKDNQFPGVAPYANLIGIKVLDSTGAGSTSTVIEGIDWCIQNAIKYNIRVINLSLGHPVYESYTTDPLCQEVEKAWNAGIVVVVAAGNDGRLTAAPMPGVTDNDGYGTCYGSIESPGNDPDVITVGAMKAVDSHRADDYIATYSSRGPTLGDDLLKPDIVAFGNQVVSLYDAQGSLDKTYTANQVLASFYGGGGAVEYMTLSGTSMATPVVSGAAALMIEANPGITPDTVKLRLMLSADKWGAGALTYGAGYLDIPAAMSSTAIATSPMTSPQLYQGLDGLVYINVPMGSPESVYGSSALWGGRAVRGLNTLTGSGVVWGDSALWGGHAIWGCTAIWGKDTTNACISGDGGD
jgi:serine protease AprX